MKLHFELITPERVVVSKEVDSVSVETQDGQITILPEHIPLVALMKVGEIVLRSGAVEERLATSQGFLEVFHGGEVKAFVDTAEKPEEINIDIAQEAKQRAQEAMKTQKDKLAFFKAKLQHDKSLVRLKVARRHHKHTTPTTTTH